MKKIIYTVCRIFRRTNTNLSGTGERTRSIFGSTAKKRIEIIMGISMIAIITVSSVIINVMRKHEQNDIPNSNGNIVQNQENIDEYGLTRQEFEKITKQMKKEKHKVVIDAGHGGVDPGKVGINNVLEKDINLNISMKLKEMLENTGITVVMTRETDAGLYKETDSRKKISDMRARVKLVNDENPDICISIHQNSFSSGSVSGAQTFYYSKSSGGKKLAKMIQNSVITNLNNQKQRKEKSNNNYYILLNVKCPAAIIECGFLSNWEEAELLSDEAYQQEMAKVIYMGIINYLLNI